MIPCRKGYFEIAAGGYRSHAAAARLFFRSRWDDVVEERRRLKSFKQFFNVRHRVRLSVYVHQNRTVAVEDGPQAGQTYSLRHYFLESRKHTGPGKSLSNNNGIQEINFAELVFRLRLIQ